MLKKNNTGEMSLDSICYSKLNYDINKLIDDQNKYKHLLDRSRYNEIINQCEWRELDELITAEVRHYKQYKIMNWSKLAQYDKDKIDKQIMINYSLSDLSLIMNKTINKTLAEFEEN